MLSWTHAAVAGGLAVCALVVAVRWRRAGAERAPPPPLMASAWRQRHAALPLLSRRAAYTHGSWMGTAGHVLSSDAWRAQLASRTPAAYRRVAAALAASGAAPHTGVAIAALENSPILAAFGSAQVHAGAGGAGPAPPHAHHAVVLEWDTHLEPGAVREAAHALGEEGRGGARLAPSHRAQLSAALAGSMVIAHGSLWDTLRERALGLAAYAEVKAVSGDMHVRHWLEAYFGALGDMAPALAAAAQPRGTPRPLVSVFLDVKSSLPTPPVLGLLVEGLNAMGVHVWGVGSFLHTQVRDGGAFPSMQTVAVLAPPGAPGCAEGEEGAQGRVRTLTFRAPLRLFIVSMPGEVQRGVADGTIPKGADVLFNASTLLVREGEGGGGRWRPDTRVLDGLAALVASHGLQLGLYAQESSLDVGHLTALVHAVNAYDHVFAHGWTYANLPGTAAGDIPPSRGFALPWWLKPLLHVPWRAQKMSKAGEALLDAARRRAAEEEARQVQARIAALKEQAPAKKRGRKEDSPARPTAANRRGSPAPSEASSTAKRRPKKVREAVEEGEEEFDDEQMGMTAAMAALNTVMAKAPPPPASRLAPRAPPPPDVMDVEDESDTDAFGMPVQPVRRSTLGATRGGGGGGGGGAGTSPAGVGAGVGRVTHYEDDQVVMSSRGGRGRPAAAAPSAAPAQRAPEHHVEAAPARWWPVLSPPPAPAPPPPPPAAAAPPLRTAGAGGMYGASALRGFTGGGQGRQPLPGQVQYVHRSGPPPAATSAEVLHGEGLSPPSQPGWGARSGVHTPGRTEGLVDGDRASVLTVPSDTGKQRAGSRGAGARRRGVADAVDDLAVVQDDAGAGAEAEAAADAFAADDPALPWATRHAAWARGVGRKLTRLLGLRVDTQLAVSVCVVAAATGLIYCAVGWYLHHSSPEWLQASFVARMMDLLKTRQSEVECGVGEEASVRYMAMRESACDLPAHAHGSHPHHAPCEGAFAALGTRSERHVRVEAAEGGTTYTYTGTSSLRHMTLACAVPTLAKRVAGSVAQLLFHALSFLLSTALDFPLQTLVTLAVLALGRVWQVGRARAAREAEAQRAADVLLPLVMQIVYARTDDRHPACPVEPLFSMAMDEREYSGLGHAAQQELRARVWPIVKARLEGATDRFRVVNMEVHGKAERGIVPLYRIGTVPVVEVPRAVLPQHSQASMFGAQVHRLPHGGGGVGGRAGLPRPGTFHVDAGHALGGSEQGEGDARALLGSPMLGRLVDSVLSHLPSASPGKAGARAAGTAAGR